MAGDETQPQHGAPVPAQVLALAGASRDKADAFLDLQMEEIHKRDPYEISHLRLRRISDLGRVAFQASLGILAMAAVLGLTAMVWNAAHSEGLIIESFAVPPDLAARGLTGEVIASKTLDELTVLQTTGSARASKTFASSWGDDIKVDIPDTGVSVGEAYRFLKNWLGRESRIGGEIVRGKDGIAVTARVSGAGAFTVTGTETDIEVMIHKLAEHIYARTQPYRYGVYLMRHARNGEAITVFREMALNGPMEERPWAYSGWAAALPPRGGLGQSLRLRGLELQPDNSLLLSNITATYLAIGQWSKAQVYGQRTQAANRNAGRLVDPVVLPQLQKADQMRSAGLSGAYDDGARAAAELRDMPHSSLNGSVAHILAIYLALGHDIAAARFAVDNADPFVGGNGMSRMRAELGVRMTIALMAQNGPEGGALARRYLAPADIDGNIGNKAVVALALAGAKDFAAAERVLSATPGTCYPCLRARAQIAEYQHQSTRADWWFARAVVEGQPFPHAEAEWGMALLARGKPDAAIEKFKLSNEKGPHFADPLEGWGEALMTQNQSHRALEKFAEAEKYAPNWGRLHLKWGQALAYSGNKTEAAKHFARAAQLDLTTSEKQELARIAR